MDNHLTVGNLTLSLDVSPANWITTQVRNFQHDVASLVPPVFEAYARVLHPAQLGHDEELEVRWEAIAKANHKAVTATMEWESIMPAGVLPEEDRQPGIWDYPPTRGSLPLRPAVRLAAVLAAHTTTPNSCWFAVWDGYSNIALASNSDIPRVQLPRRSMLLFYGPINAAATSLGRAPMDQRANVWWPADRAWCAASDVDTVSTYVGATRHCIDALLRAEGLEVMQSSPDDPVG